MIHENKIKFIVGKKISLKFCTSPFNKIVLKFIEDLSNDLLYSKETSNYPDIKTFAFWCRRQNILKLMKKINYDEIRLGLGLIFHITPSNIPTNFAYSLIFGLINGNSNLVKVPSKKFKQVEIICKSINKILKKYPLIRKMITIIKYENLDEFTKKISSICNARIIWGGNNTIRQIRKFSLNERSLDLAFADRYSICVIETKKLEKLSSRELDELVKNFYNDTYLVDQNACSSPHLILWIGNNIKKVRKKFWSNLHKVVKKKYDISSDAVIDKYSKLCGDIISQKNMRYHEKYENLINTVYLNDLNKNLHELRGKWGYFYECKINNLNQITKYINNYYQTLTYFGLDKKNLKKFILNKKPSGIDRIVPIGQALDMSFFWDGFDLNKILSRVVDIK